MKPSGIAPPTRLYSVRGGAGDTKFAQTPGVTSKEIEYPRSHCEKPGLLKRKEMLFFPDGSEHNKKSFIVKYPRKFSPC